MPGPDGVFGYVVAISDTIGGVSHKGAGVLIGLDEVLTAADVVWSSEGGTASNIIVIPGYSDGLAPAGQFTVDRYHYLPVNNGSGATNVDRQGDIALLHLSHPTPFFGVAPSAFVDWTSSFRGGPVPVGPLPTVKVVGYPDFAGGDSMYARNLYSLDDGQGATLREFLTAGLDKEGPLPAGPGVIGAPVLRSNINAFGYTDVGIAVSGDRIAEISTPVGALITQWVAADHSSVPQTSGAIAGAIPPLFHTITRDTGAVGVDPREAALVDSFSYLASRPDVATAGMDAAVHFANFGWHEGTSADPLFDTKYYLSHNPDVAAAGMDPLLHYALYGWHEGRDPSSAFSTSAYLATHPDVALAGMNPLEHYLYFGVEEGRAIIAGKA